MSAKLGRNQLNGPLVTLEALVGQHWPMGHSLEASVIDLILFLVFFPVLVRALSQPIQDPFYWSCWGLSLGMLNMKHILHSCAMYPSLFLLREQKLISTRIDLIEIPFSSGSRIPKFLARAWLALKLKLLEDLCRRVFLTWSLILVVFLALTACFLSFSPRGAWLSFHLVLQVDGTECESIQNATGPFAGVKALGSVT